VALVPDNRTVTVATPVASTGTDASVILPDIKETLPVGAVEAGEPVDRITDMSVSCCPPVSEVADVVSVSVLGRS
jgi:hypothetical protein